MIFVYLKNDIMTCLKMLTTQNCLRREGRERIKINKLSKEEHSEEKWKDNMYLIIILMLVEEELKVDRIKGLKNLKELKELKKVIKKLKEDIE